MFVCFHTKMKIHLSEAVDTTVSMLRLVNRLWWGDTKHCDLSLTFMLHIFYVSRSVVEFRRVFVKSKRFFFFRLFKSFLLSEFIIHFCFCLNCEHEPVLLNKWKDP